MNSEYYISHNYVNVNDIALMASLAERIKLNDRHAECELINSFSAYLMSFIHSKLNEEQISLDIFQETFTQVIIKLRQGKLLKPEALKYYITSTASHLIYQAITYRTIVQYNEDNESIDSLQDNGMSGFDCVVTDDNTRLLTNAIDSLPTERDRQLLTSYFLHQQEKKTVCDQLNLTSSQFDRVLFRAKSRLKEVITLEFDDYIN
ncbi:RNA polymerase sigma factor [Psychrobium sp. 1_MG-2023]|uniref:RNA polymerase sigma factor n=1 Tax=Psychrobium sp. 1_MG-2023 TaxID=3062624 RepID=UPI000C32CC2C|nr:sigma-70 family RNA polymerase sigma factor [Psychrobium sp. 1_MG-2023]MDP2561949.1 sigma-70 family RNA polymerase sigma factor [Psychrobium sp. 1_MG-2023]PKF58669.1 hypothetical protein CW748_03270 [Alteromonadales bacterium alter-6D02]